MKSHRFHTTIAFIPWNYDRSRPEVVRLFRDNQSFYSLCLHGNNHAHREFGDYQQNSLSRQIFDLDQGTARMDKMHAVTGLAYDRFMVFPHAVAPQATFDALQAHGFLGTANSVDVPLDRAFPNDPLFLLKPYTIAYGNIPSLSRFSTEAPVSHVDLAIHAYLGNPLLFYAHQAFFAQGAGAFNATADLVHQLSPETRWLSLGDLMRHLYEIRRREDGNVDVRMLSREIALRTSPRENVVYFVGSAASPANRVIDVKVDGQSVRYRHTDTRVEFQLASPRKSEALVRLTYEHDAAPVEVDLQKGTFRATALRWISDGRDRYISRYSIGRSFIDGYYRLHGETWEAVIERHWLLLLTFMMSGSGLAWFNHRQRHLRSSQLAFSTSRIPS